LVARLQATRSELARLATVRERLRVDGELDRRGRQPADVTDELDTARDVLAAAGIQATIRVDTGPRVAALDSDLAAALRESTTNVVCHSDARTCLIEITPTDAAIRLRVLNDGQPPAAATAVPG
jgi:two-component system, NarL family, sensor histidine kinase DesK